MVFFVYKFCLCPFRYPLKAYALYVHIFISPFLFSQRQQKHISERTSFIVFFPSCMIFSSRFIPFFSCSVNTQVHVKVLAAESSQQVQWLLTERERDNEWEDQGTCVAGPYTHTHTHTRKASKRKDLVKTDRRESWEKAGRIGCHKHPRTIIIIVVFFIFLIATVTAAHQQQKRQSCGPIKLGYMHTATKYNVTSCMCVHILYTCM